MIHGKFTLIELGKRFYLVSVDKEIPGLTHRHLKFDAEVIFKHLGEGVVRVEKDKMGGWR